MRLSQFLKENEVSSALNITEPEMGKKYDEEQIRGYLSKIKAAVKSLRSEPDSEAKDSKMADLLDKKSKWENVNTETTPEEPAPDGEDGGEPDKTADKAEQDKEKRQTDAETDKENNIKKSLDKREKNKEDVEKSGIDKKNKEIDKSEKKKEDQSKNNEKDRENLKKKQKKESRIITTRILL